LTGIVGRLQEMSSLIARLEQENETLREENDALLAGGNAAELEARSLQAENLIREQGDELAQLRAALHARSEQVAALQARGVASQQAAAAAARTLREIAATLES